MNLNLACCLSLPDYQYHWEVNPLRQMLTFNLKTQEVVLKSGSIDR
jgi:hypothetical protein